MTFGSIDVDRALLQVSVQLQAAPRERPRLVAAKSQPAAVAWRYADSEDAGEQGDVVV